MTAYGKHDNDFSESRVRLSDTEYIMDKKVTDLADNIAFVLTQLHTLNMSPHIPVDFSGLITMFKVLGDAVCTRTRTGRRDRKIIFERKRPITPSDFAVMYMNVGNCKLNWFRDKTQREARTDELSLSHLESLNSHVTLIYNQSQHLNVVFASTTKSSLKDYSRVENRVAPTETEKVRHHVDGNDIKQLNGLLTLLQATV